MVMVLWTFLAMEAAAQLLRVLTSSCWSRLTDRGISKLGAPSRPTPFPHVSVEGNHELRREEAVVARPALRGVGDPVPEEASPPRSTHGDRRKDVFEKSALMMDSPSATIVPLPTELRNGVSCLTSSPKFEPVCRTPRRS